MDASFAPDWQDNDGVSVSGLIILLAGGPIAWASHKQRHVAGSTCESEFIALSECLNVIEWLRHFLGELGFLGETIRTNRQTGGKTNCCLIIFINFCLFLYKT